MNRVRGYKIFLVKSSQRNDQVFHNIILQIHSLVSLYCIDFPYQFASRWNLLRQDHHKRTTIVVCPSSHCWRFSMAHLHPMLLEIEWNERGMSHKGAQLYSQNSILFSLAPPLSISTPRHI